MSSQASNDVFPKQGLACYCVPNQGIGNENTLDLTLITLLLIKTKTLTSYFSLDYIL